MKAYFGVALCLICAGSSVGQSGYDPLPRIPCLYDSMKFTTARVKERPPSKYPTFSPGTVQLPGGTIVTVNLTEKSWSCVTASVRVGDRWKTRTGWVQSSELESPRH